MNRHIIAFVLAVALLLATSLSYGLEFVTAQRAERIATNWVSLVTHEEGDWGGSSEAFVDEVIEYRPEERLLGYLCHVKPQGYIIVSLFEGLAPVKAYSATCDLDPEVGGSIAEILRLKLTCIHEGIEHQVGPLEAARPDQVQALAEIDYSEAWLNLDCDPARFREKLESGGALQNYQQGDILLTCSWHQGDPYNIYCPTPAEVEDVDCDRAHCSVGCVALAAAMLMHYWCWPPGPDWYSMPDRLDEHSTPQQVDAVASLCSAIGVLVGMDYCNGKGCASGADTEDMVPLYKLAFGYSSATTKIDREDYDQAGWFEEIKLQINQNRPIHYRIGGHSLVVDGWKRSGGIRRYHLNMGWDGGKPGKKCWEKYEGINTNTWYAVDGIPCSRLVWEFMLTNIRPITAVGGLVMGSYPWNDELRYSYFDVDAAGIEGTFHPNHRIQFVRGVSVKGVGPLGIRFYAIPDLPGIRMFTKADMSKGVRIDRGAIRLYNGGGLKLY